jgi:hypothetical protein
LFILTFSLAFYGSIHNQQGLERIETSEKVRGSVRLIESEAFQLPAIYTLKRRRRDVKMMVSGHLLFPEKRSRVTA